jgi:rubrerythrin
MYPPMVVQAKEENHKARVMLGWAEKVEQVHAELYKQALAALEQGKDLGEDVEFYLCPVCGHIEMGKPEGRCKVCGADAATFSQL